jgi:hypothetical protein
LQKKEHASGPERLHARTGSIGVLILVGFTIFLRAPDFRSPQGSQNLEAPYHVLLTMRALGASSASEHYFLPTVTLGSENDRAIPWGATLATSRGQQIYTSFPPAGFVVPYAILLVLGITPSLTSLAYVNAGIGVATAWLLYALLHMLLGSLGLRGWTAVGGAWAGCLVGIFSREALQSTGVAYWSQSLYHPVLLLTIWAFLNHYRRRDARSLWILALLAFVGPLIEWTAYATNMGLVVVSLLARIDEKRLTRYISWTTISSGGLMLLHFAWALGASTLAQTMRNRFAGRSAYAGSLVSLLQGYALSFGAFLLVLLLLLAFLSLRKRHAAGFETEVETKDGTRLVAMALGLSAFALTENLLLMQHASSFSFDRFKLAFPISILFIWGYAALKPLGKVVLACALLAASVHGYRSYRADLASYAAWASVHASNQELAVVLERSAQPCSLFSSNLAVRGYTNVLLGRGVWEKQSLPELKATMTARRACEGFYLEGDVIYPDLPRFRKAFHIEQNGMTSAIWESSGK